MRSVSQVDFMKIDAEARLQTILHSTQQEEDLLHVRPWSTR